MWSRRKLQELFWIRSYFWSYIFTSKHQFFPFLPSLYRNTCSFQNMAETPLESSSNPLLLQCLCFFVFLMVALSSVFFSKPCIILSHIHCFLLQIVIVPPVTHFLHASHPHTPTHTHKSNLWYTHITVQYETQCCSHMLAHPHTSRKCVTYTHNRGQRHKQPVYLFILTIFI